MRAHTKTAGFTIVETMIVLAVTGLLFVTIAASMSGRQAKAEFQTASGDIRDSLQQIIGEVQTGYYPNNGTFTCSDSGGQINIQPNMGGGGQQGTNQGCVFIGKVIQFDSPGQGTYNSIPVVGLQSANSLAGANPTLLAGAGSAKISSYTTNPLKFGLQLVAIKYDNGVGKTNAGAVGILFNITQSGDTQQIQTGTIYPDVYALNGDYSLPGFQDPSIAAGIINKELTKGFYTVNPSKGVWLCFARGDDYAEIQIGGGKTGQLSVELTTSVNTPNCGW